MNTPSKFLSLLLSLLLCLSLTACGSSEDDLSPPEDGSGGNALVTDMAFLDGMWSIDGLSVLYFDSQNGYYVYHSVYGPTGCGEFTDETGKPMINYAGFLYDFYLREDGVLLPNQNGEGGSDTPSIDHYTFCRDDEAELAIWTPEDLDGMWQNAAGETIVIDAALGEYTAHAQSYASSGTIGDEWQGQGPYLYDNGSRAYLCPAPDGNSFTISSGLDGRYSEDGHFNGVFYRNGDADAYTDLEQAEFYDEIQLEYYDGWVWYFDGVNIYSLGEGYEIRGDGLAYYKEDGKSYPVSWVPGEFYDPSPEQSDNEQGTGSAGSSLSTDVWRDDLYQHDACAFEGIWYPDGDLAAETYIRIDDTGRWSYYRRAPGTEPEEIDYGTFSYSIDETSIYYADSALHSGVSYRVFELDDDVLVWGSEGSYYLME